MVLCPRCNNRADYVAHDMEYIDLTVDGPVRVCNNSESTFVHVLTGAEVEDGIRPPAKLIGDDGVVLFDNGFDDFRIELTAKYDGGDE